MRPMCHGVKMSPANRRVDDVGAVYIGYICQTCGHKKEAQINNGN